MKTHENPQGIKFELQSLDNGAGDLIYLLTVKVRYKGMNNFTTVLTEEYSAFKDASVKMKAEMDKWQEYQAGKEYTELSIAEKINEYIKQFFPPGVFETEVTESGIPGVVNYRTHEGTKLAVPIQITEDKIKHYNWRLACNGQARVNGTEVKILSHNFHAARK
jgi:hypothetical protein